MINKRELKEQLKKKEEAIIAWETQEEIYDPDTQESRRNVVLDVLEFLSQPWEERQRQIKEWDDYYEAVKKTKAYRRWEMQREAFKKGDLALVKKIAAVSRRAREEGRFELTKPAGVDFYSLYLGSDFQRYKRLKGEVASLKKQLGEVDLLETDKGIFS